MPDTVTSGSSEAEEQAAKEPRAHTQADLQLLAERIVQLLKQEARLERERLGGRRSR